MSFKPFANEADTVDLGGLTVENRLDRVSVYGSLDITRDKLGLSQARALHAILTGALAVLEAEALPDQISVSCGELVPNPFSLD